ncbi:MAG: NAD-binding protein [Longimonas sp.]|uniref:potassium channel family protein n=1 Tax=Longimonas sp. TaxID=2039626 RepID=UPI0033527792
MKFYSTQLAYLFDDKEARRNLIALSKYIAFLIVSMILLSVGFQLIMWYVEGQDHSWVSAFYWTLVTMSTLGFGDITFHTDVGRLYSMFVVGSGIVLLLIVLPFAFIRYFYAPWLEAQIHARAPRFVSSDMQDHVIICNHDPITPGLIDRLETDGIPYVLIETDADQASDYYLDGISVILGDFDSKETFENARAPEARMILANRSDVENTNIALTVREVAPDTPITAIAHSRDAVDILELVGCSDVLSLKHMLGEQLANRINARHCEVHPIGRYKDLVLAELPVQNTPLEGRTIRETTLRADTGVSIIGVWERGALEPARPNHELTASSVPVVIGMQDQIDALDQRLSSYDISDHPVLVIGGGTVGESTARALLDRGIDVNIVERDPARCKALRRLDVNVFEGDASDYSLLDEAGIQNAPSVLLTTHDDAVNIYLASYCRRLNERLRIVSRIVHRRNMEAIHRAGADFVLGYAMLGIESVWAVLMDKELVVMGEGLDLFTREVPPSLHHKTLAESDIGAQTGLTVVAVLCPNKDVITQVNADTALEPGRELLMVGTDEQYHDFVERYG